MKNNKNIHIENHRGKYTASFIFIMLLILSTVPGTANAQTPSSPGEIEEKIRKLEAEQVEYLIEGNVAEMRKAWAEDFTVNILSMLYRMPIQGPFKLESTYTRFERNVEKVLHHDSVIVVMGNELVVPKSGPKGTAHDTDQPIDRRLQISGCSKTANGSWLPGMRRTFVPQRNDNCLLLPKQWFVLKWTTNHHNQISKFAQNYFAVQNAQAYIIEISKRLPNPVSISLW
jgi:hypothetical protein